MSEANDIGKLLELVRALNVPDSRPRVLRTMIRRRRPLPRPVIGLIGTPASSALLVEIYRWLGESGGRRATPRARVDLSAADLPPDALAPDPNATGEEIEGHCLPILQRLVEGFSTDDTAMGPIRFPRYRTADWLTRQRVTSDETEAAVELRARLPKLLRSGSPASSSAGDASEAAAGDIVSRVVFGVFALWPVLRLWLWISGRIPGMSKVTRWFMHQRYLAPELSDSFLGFATRLTASGRSDENEEQIAKLLVHAFLEDLRDAYRRPVWRPSGWRRTAYPVALLGPVAPDSAGARLLARINDIRNETGLSDPLVVLACLESPPARPPVRDLARIGDLTNLDTLEGLLDRPSSGQEPDPLQRWLRNIDHMRTNRLSYAWYLPLRVRLPDPLDGCLRDPRYAHLAVPPSPPLAARRWFVAASVLVPVILLVAAALVYVPPLRGAACSHWPWTSGVSVAMREGECVGYSAGPGQLFGDDPELIAVQRHIFRLNAEAENELRADSERRLVTVVYFAGLSFPRPHDRYPLAQAEELAGLAAQQQLVLNKPRETGPLLRVVIANGGTEMNQARWVVDNHLRELFDDDPTVLGVVGMDRSSDQTHQAITRLGELGIPVMATTLTADEMKNASPLYFQASPSNATHARLVADYVRGATYPDGRQRYRRMVLYYPEVPGDRYVANLIDDLKEELGGFSVGEETWKEQKELNDIELPCRSPDFDPENSKDREAKETLLFYAGRNVDFSAFADAVVRACPGVDGPPILGNDTLTRVIINDPAESLPPNLTVRYVAKAAPLILAKQPCLRGETSVGGRPMPPEQANLCYSIRQVLQGLDKELDDLREEPEPYQPSWAGDRLGLGFDAGSLLMSAVRKFNGSMPSRAAIAIALREISYPGATGRLDFTAGRTAETASLAVLVIDPVSTQEPHQCLLTHPRTTNGTGCPTGTGSGLENWEGPASPAPAP
ncbi:ABC transporter substrate-binding protein [Nocardia shimofusensis]|uniref:ABC transporter substrate-binding protein n=1 Tax=Nocardia shimofusensis TaxID=228596 RepID=UPI000837481C|nr:ABC transporter substrate-binding protein [Nocardia shimofusensis]